jgi:hypothetical protein
MFLPLTKETASGNAPRRTVSLVRIAGLPKY